MENDTSGGPVTWRAFAKLNEELRVLGRRPDGYHEVRTVLQTIDLADEIRVVPAAGFRFTTTSGPADESNLVVRAVRAFEEATGIEVRLDIHLTKHVPHGAGLGGGSADAAVTLMGLARWYGAPLPGSMIQSLLAGMGSDVPFFALGGAALAIGRGDCLFPLDVGEAGREAPRWYVLVHPPLAVSTVDAYSWLDRDTTRRTQGLTETHEYTTILGFCARFVPHLGARGPGPASCLNDFELPLFQRFPELAEIKGRLLAAGAVRAAISGSGATVFGRFDGPVRARAAADVLGRDYDVSVVRSLGRGEYFARVFGK